MNAPKTIENQETKDWLNLYQRAHLMTEKEVQETIKTPAVLQAFASSKYEALPSEVRIQYELEDENYDRVSEYTKSMEQKGIAKGREEGREEGVVIGEARERAKARQEKIETVKKMLKKGFSLEDAAECTDLTIAEIERIITLL